MKNPVRNKLRLFPVALFILMLLADQSNAQGFVKTYPVNSNFWSIASFLEILPNGYCISGYETFPNNFGAFQLITSPNGTQTSFEEDTVSQPGKPLDCGAFIEFDTVSWGAGNSSIVARLFSPNGVVHWIDTIPQAFPGISNIGRFAVKTVDHTFFLIGLNSLDARISVQKLDESGQLLSTYIIPDHPNGNDFAVDNQKASPDGGLLFHLSHTISQGVYFTELIKFAANGSVEWEKSMIPDAYKSLEYASDGNFYAVESGSTLDPPITDKCDLVKYAPNGDVIWSLRVREALGIGNLVATVVVPTLDQGTLVCGSFWTNPVNPIFGRTAIGRFDSDGHLLWKKEYFGIEGLFITDGKALPNGNFALCGSINWDLMLMGIDSLGNVFPNALEGKILQDQNADCTADAADTPLANWVVTVLANGAEYYATTDSNGHYHISNLPGDTTYTLEVSVQTPSFLWEACSAPTITMPDTSGLTLVSDIAVETFVPCPYMVVDLGATEFVPCHKSVFYVNYANFGSGAATNTAVEVYLPEAITITGAPIPYTQTGQTLRFEVGTVAPADLGSFFFFGLVSCDSAYIGQALTVEAHIFPDTFCYIPPSWSGATIVLEADCLGDSVQLLIKNKGVAPTTEALDYLIIDDDVVMMQGTLPAGFPVNGEQNMRLLANGSTFRISAEQEPNHPLPGNPSVAVESCNGTNYGFVTGFSNQTGDPFGDVFSQLVSGPGNNSQKWVSPTGLQAPHYVDPGAPLSYVLRFKNTGPDVVSRVVLRDTLSPWLLPASIVPGASSHPYTWSLEGNGIVVFTFDPIALPTEGTSPDECSGYLQFSVQMRPDLPMGTVIENRASIYLDQSPAVVTNTIFNTIDTAYLEVQLVSVIFTDAEERNHLQIFPNPTSGNVSIWLKNETNQEGSIVLSDMLGKTRLQQDFAGNHLEIRREDLPAGIYFLQVLQHDKVVANGKVIFQ